MIYTAEFRAKGDKRRGDAGLITRHIDASGQGDAEQKAQAMAAKWASRGDHDYLIVRVY